MAMWDIPPFATNRPPATMAPFGNAASAAIEPIEGKKPTLDHDDPFQRAMSTADPVLVDMEKYPPATISPAGDVARTLTNPLKFEVMADQLDPFHWNRPLS